MSCWRVSAKGATPTNDMSNQPRNTSEVRADQVASKKYQTIKLGMDVHADSIVVVRILDHGAPQPAQKFAPGKFLEWVKTQLALADAVHSCYEAGPFGYGLHRDLVQLGVQNRSEEHTSELQSLRHLVCRLLRAKKNTHNK